MLRKDNPLPQLGELENAVLEYLWEVDEADVAQAHKSVGQARGIVANTVGSALERLYKKGLVSRTKVSHAYRYRVTLSRDSFVARRMVDALGGTETLREAGLMSAFVDLVADEDVALLDRLADLIGKKRRADVDGE